MNLLDASALLAFLLGEPGGDVVEDVLTVGDAACTSVNWSEVAQKVRAHDRNWDLARALLSSYDLTVESVDGEDGEAAARRWRRGDELSLADRICLAVGERLDATVWTADRTWGAGERLRQIR